MVADPLIEVFSGVLGIASGRLNDDSSPANTPVLG